MSKLKESKVKQGRPNTVDSTKVIYQRVAFEYDVYKRFKKIVQDLKNTHPELTISDVQTAMMDEFEKRL